MSSKFFQIISLFAVGIFISLLSAGAGAAVISFDDDAGSQNGRLLYKKSGGPLIGLDIEFHSILGVATPSNSGNRLVCDSCTLSFTTGNNISDGPNLWQFAGGGSLTISGTARDKANIIASGTLVSGSFTSVTVTGDGNNNGALIMSGFGTDLKHPDLLSHFGIKGKTPFTFADTNISLGNVSYPSEDGAFVATVTNADFDNTEVPIPAAAWLFGTALFGLVSIAKRKKA